MIGPAVTRKQQAFVEGRRFGLRDSATADQSARLQAAIDEATERKLPLRLPEGVMVAAGLTYGQDLMIQGSGRNRTTLRLDPDSNGSILAGGSPAAGYDEPVDVVLRDLTFDGDAPNSNITGGGGALLHAYRAKRVVCERVSFINSRVYGCGFQGVPTHTNSFKRGPITDLSFYDCEFLNNGWDSDGSDNSADGVDIKFAERVLFARCHAAGNSDKGFNPRGRFLTMLACTAINNVTGISASPINSITTTTTLSADIDSDDTTVPLTSVTHLLPEGVVKIGDEHIYYAAISGSSLTGCIRSYGAGAAASHSSGATVSCPNQDAHMTFVACGAEGNSAAGISAYNGTDSDCYVVFEGCHSRLNGGSGLGVTAPGSTGVTKVQAVGCVGVGNTQHGWSSENVAALDIRGGLYADNTVDGIRLDDQVGAKIEAECTGNGGSGIRLIGTCSNIDAGGSVLSGNTSVALAGTGYRNTRNVRGALQTVTAAASLTLPAQRPMVQVNGTTGITSITATWDGDTVVLRFTNTVTVTDGSNLKLNGNLSAGGGTTLSLVCDGTNWLEVARSVN